MAKMTGRTKVVAAPASGAKGGALKAALAGAKANAGLVATPRGRSKGQAVNARARVASVGGAPAGARGGRNRAGSLPSMKNAPGKY